VSRFHSSDGRAEDRANMMHGIAPAPAVALAVEGVSYSYGTRQALADVTFSIAPATFAVLLGLNGAGKTTLFSLITRLYGTQRGQISILGHDVARTPGDALRLIGVVFQSRTLDLDLSVMQNLIYHAALHGIGRRAARRRASEMLDQIDLADRAQDKIRNLSGGQMRRVEIARALLHRPRLLVLDEPTVGLDVKSRADILAQMRRLVAREGTCVLWATHLIDEVSADDDVIVLHHGHVLARGPVARVVSDAGATDIRSAFARLTKISTPDAPDEAA
jgi:ABC-2 type transport system ATP-binding protein